MKNRVKFISNLNVFNNIKITLYYSVYMRTSGEKYEYRMKHNVFNRFHVLI